MRNASAKRREEFAAGRICAAVALKSLGRPAVYVGRAAGGAPIWPTGVRGSISHTHDIAAAVVTSVETTRAIGLDIEIVGAVEPDCWSMLFSTAEHRRLEQASPPLRNTLSTAFFAAKEAFYKAQWPITREWLTFLDIEIELDDRSFTVFPKASKAWIRPLGEAVTGSLAVSGGVVAALLQVPAL